MKNLVNGSLHTLVAVDKHYQFLGTKAAASSKDPSDLQRQNKSKDLSLPIRECLFENFRRALGKHSDQIRLMLNQKQWPFAKEPARSKNPI
jgi:hypothetical protein